MRLLSLILLASLSSVNSQATNAPITVGPAGKTLYSLRKNAMTELSNKQAALLPF